VPGNAIDGGLNLLKLCKRRGEKQGLETTIKTDNHTRKRCRPNEKTISEGGKKAHIRD